MLRLTVRLVTRAVGVAFALALWCAPSGAVSLDKAGDIKLGVRAYVNARIGTEDTDQLSTPTVEAGTFPVSAAGHLRQNREFIEVDWEHDLHLLVEKGIGPFALLEYLPFSIKRMKYHLAFRGQGDTVYDWGPKEYSTAAQFKTLPGNPVGGLPVDVPKYRSQLRQLGTSSEKLFLAYIEGDIGKLFFRFGRQLLSWGETDVFRLLDNINPLDSSFGGFLTDLDERRVPLDMLRLQYSLPDWGPFTEAFLEAYGAIDNNVGFYPRTPYGSPWTLPNLGSPNAPSNTTQTLLFRPPVNFTHIRGGGRLVWNMFDATFSVAHYYTYLDLPALQVFVQPNFPLQNFDNGFTVEAHETAPLVAVTGASGTFALPSLYSVVRSEFAYFKDEPRYTQKGIDPFIFHPSRGPTTGGRDQGDSFNYALGFDINRFVRWINPNQTLLISTQLFYKHLFDAVERTPIPGRPGFDQGEVLPVPVKYVVARGLAGFPPTDPVYAKEPTNTFLNTLFIGTSYRSGTVSPGFTFLYDWGGAFLYQPSVKLSYDPFRFYVDLSIIDAHTLKGGSGISFYKDRDNIQFRIEYSL